ERAPVVVDGRGVGPEAPAGRLGDVDGAVVAGDQDGATCVVGQPHAAVLAAARGTARRRDVKKGGPKASLPRVRRTGPARSSRRVGRAPGNRSGGGLVGFHQGVRPTAQRPATSRVPRLPSLMSGPPPFSGVSQPTNASAAPHRDSAGA